MAKFTAGPLPLFGVLLLALALRVWGLTWGLPSATHYFSYHPDESVVLIASSLTMNVFTGHLLPHSYHYGSLQFYLVCFANTLAALFGGVNIVPNNFAVWYPQWAKMYLIGRMLTVSMGVGTVWATYAIGLRLWSHRTGLLAALTLTVMPLHAQQSHFLTVDVPATFWVVLSLLWSVRLATGDPKPLKAALVAGLFAGLAAATKYNMALAVLPLLGACWRPTPAQAPTLPKGKVTERPSLNAELSSTFPLGRVGACAGVGLLSSVLAFCVGCPGALLETETFLKDVRFEAVHVQNKYDPTFRDTGNGFVYHITHNLDAGLGLPLLVLALLSVGYALYRRGRGDSLLAAFALPYYVLISLAAVRYARYTIPLLPILALWVGRMLADGSRLPHPILRRATVAVTTIGLLATSVDTLALLSAMTGQDTRDKALTWLNNYTPASAQVGFAVQPWFGDVPVSPYFALPGIGAWQSVTPPETLKRIVYSGKDWNVAALRLTKPNSVALSEYDYDDALRLHSPEAIAYIAELKHDYPYIRKFSPLHLGGYVGHLSGNLPHDMTYPSPEIMVFSQSYDDDNMSY